jgi:hypothetical protein
LEAERGEEKDPKEKKVDKRTALEKDRQANLYQWFAGLPMRPLPKDVARGLEFFGRHAFSNQIKIAEIDRTKKQAELVSPRTSGVNRDDVDFVRKNLLARGFRVVPRRQFPRDAYVRMKLLRVRDILQAPVLPAAPPFLPFAAVHRPGAEESISFEQMVERAPPFRGQPRMPEPGTLAASHAFADAVNLHLQTMIGYGLGDLHQMVGESAGWDVAKDMLKRIMSGAAGDAEPEFVAKELLNWPPVERLVGQEVTLTAKASEDYYDAVSSELESNTGQPLAIWMHRLVDVGETMENVTRWLDKNYKTGTTPDAMAERIISHVQVSGGQTESAGKTFEDLVTEGHTEEEHDMSDAARSLDKTEARGPSKPEWWRVRLYNEGGEFVKALTFKAENRKEATKRADRIEQREFQKDSTIDWYELDGPHWSSAVHEGRDMSDKPKRTLVEFSTPERQSAILWARGFPVKRTTPKTVLWFHENEAYAWLNKIAEIDRGTKQARVLTPKVTSAMTGRQIKMVENALRCTQFAVHFVEAF